MSHTEPGAGGGPSGHERDEPPTPQTPQPTPGAATSRVSGGGGEGGGGGGGRTLVAWLLLVCVTGLMIGLHSVDSKHAKAHEPAVPGEPVAEAADPENDAGIMLKLIGRYSMGVRSAADSSPILKDEAVTEKLVGALDDKASTPTDRLRVAILTAELSGAEAGRSALAKLMEDAGLDEGLRRDGELLRAMLGEDVKVARDAVSAEDAERLKTRHHWFAEVALSRGLADSDPARAAVLDSCKKTVIALFTGLGVAALAFVVGFMLAITGVILLILGKISPAYAPMASLPGTSSGQRAALLESLVLFMLLLLGLSLLASVIEEAGGPDVKLWALWLSLAAAWWPRVWGMDRTAWKRALGWHGGRGFFREVGAGFVGYLAGLPIVLVGLILTIILITVTGAKPTHPAVDQAASGAGWWATVQLMLLACVWAPVCEETFFRGAMYAHCRRWMHPLISALLVGFVFAAIHPQGWSTVPALMGLAVSFALIREWRGSIIASATAHAIQNGFVMTLNLLMLS